jgi:hypothetical protein
MPAFPTLTRARLMWLALAAVILAALAGCTLKSGGYNTTSPPKLRFFNASPDLGAVDIAVGGNPTVGLLNYETFSNYRAAATGPQAITVTLSGGTTQVLQTTQDLENGNLFSYVIFGRSGAPHALLLPDNLELPGGGNVKLRLVNATVEQPAIDLYVTNPGQDLASVTPTISSIPAGGASDFIERNAGSSEVRITPAGSKTVLYDSSQVTLSDRNAYSIVAYDRGDPGQVNVGLLTNDTLGSAAALNSIVSATRLVNAAPGVPAANVTVDQTTIAGVAYGTSSAYQQVQSGTPTATFAATATPSTTLISGSLLLPPGGASTIVLFGASGAQQGFALQDFNLLPVTPGNARLRVVNLESGGTGVITLLNGALVVGALASGQPSLYFELPPAAYNFTFADATSQAPLLTVPDVVVSANHTYTLFLLGPPGQLTFLLTQDR